MLTVEILKSVERFDTQNTRAPAFFVAFGMRARVGRPSGVDDTTFPPSTESANEPSLLQRENVMI